MHTTHILREHTKYNENKSNPQGEKAVSRGCSVRHGDMQATTFKLAVRQNE